MGNSEVEQGEICHSFAHSSQCRLLQLDATEQVIETHREYTFPSNGDLLRLTYTVETVFKTVAIVHSAIPPRVSAVHPL